MFVSQTTVLIDMARNGVLWILLAVLVVHVQHVLSDATPSYPDETRLFNNLTTGYLMCVRPSRPTAVDVFYSIKTLESLNIATQTMKTSGWMTLSWVDPRLVWTPADFANLQALEVDFIWRPKFVIANQVDGVTWHGTGTNVFRIFKDGTVRWSVPLVVETSCDVDIVKFPFDTQTCALTMNFWTVSEVEITSVMSQLQVNASYFSVNGEWEFLDSSVKVNTLGTCCPAEEIPAYTFSMTFKRRRQYYVTNLLLPTLLMSFVVVWTFLLPVESGERLGFSLTVLLAYTVMLTLTTGFLPTTSIQTPHIAIYILVVLIMCTTSVALTAIAVKFYNTTTSSPPFFLQNFCACVEMCLFCRSCSEGDKPAKTNVVSVQPYDTEKKREDLEDPGYDELFKEHNDPELNWQQVTLILDRLYFYVYLVIIVCLNTAFLAFLAV